MRAFILFTFLISLANPTESQNDTLNKFNSKGKKQGYWRIYLDERTNLTDSINSFYYSFQYYDNGTKTGPLTKLKWKNYYSLISDSITHKKGDPKPINGTFRWYNENKKLFEEDIYYKGSPVLFKSYTILKNNADSANHLFEVYDFTKRYNNTPGSFFYEVHSLYGNQGERSWYRNGKKGWKRYKCLNYDCSTEPMLFVRRQGDGKEVDKIFGDVYLNIELQKDSSDSQTLIPTNYSGEVLSVDEEKLTLTINSEILETIRPNGIVINSSNRFSFPDTLRDLYQGELRTVKFSSIKSLSYYKERPIAVVGKVLIFAGIWSALLVSPLISINYKTGDFKQNTYYTALLASGCAIVVGIPLAAIFKSQRYYNLKRSYYLKNK